MKVNYSRATIMIFTTESLLKANKVDTFRADFPVEISLFVEHILHNIFCHGRKRDDAVEKVFP